MYVGVFRVFFFIVFFLLFFHLLKYSILHIIILHGERGQQPAVTRTVTSAAGMTLDHLVPPPP